MIHNLNAMKRTMMIIAVILIILALMIVVFHHLIWVLWMNWFPEKVTLGDTEGQVLKEHIDTKRLAQILDLQIAYHRKTIMTVLLILKRTVSSL